MRLFIFNLDMVSSQWSVEDTSFVARRFFKSLIEGRVDRNLSGSGDS